MLQQRQKPEATDEVNRCRMYFALVLLVAALTAVLVREHTFWFGGDEAVTSQDTPEATQAAAVAVPAEATADAPRISAPVPKAEPKKHAEPATEAPGSGASVVASERAVLPPLGVEVVNDRAHHAVQPNKSSLNINLQPDMTSESTSQPAPPATVQQASLQVPLPQAYPSLSAKMKVQGSVLLQALIGANGVIQDLRVISGPAILSEAARQAALQWHFKPYFMNGKAVETQARITVNFVIKVWDDKVYDQQDANKKAPQANSPLSDPGN